MCGLKFFFCKSFSQNKDLKITNNKKKALNVCQLMLQYTHVLREKSSCVCVKINKIVWKFENNINDFSKMKNFLAENKI